MHVCYPDTADGVKPDGVLASSSWDCAQWGKGADVK